MKTKVIVVSAMALVIFGFTSIVNSSMDTSNATVPKHVETKTSKSMGTKTLSDKTFTAAQLAKFDGKNGRAAYVAYEGMVYDVSSKWVEGEHHGIKAGSDITSQLNKCSYHEDGFLKSVFIKYKFPQVGVFISGNL